MPNTTTANTASTRADTYDPPLSAHAITCRKCGHTESWERGNYFGERVDFAHHVCGKPGTYDLCGPECTHVFPGSNLARLRRLARLVKGST